MSNTYSYEKLYEFSKKVMLSIGCREKEAEIVAEVLIEANARGIHSHGIARLKRYIDHIEKGIITPKEEPSILFETPISAWIDGRGGVGQYIAQKAMSLAIEKAERSGVGFVSVRNSNHYGIAGYYSEMAAKKGLIGISTTNSAPLVVPTFGREALLGTNPISFAIPLSDRDPILVDMATSVVSRGKIEVYNRLGKKLPSGWAVDENGNTALEPDKVLYNLKERKGGGLLPLGGEGELMGGHKGYGLMLLVELFTGGLSLGEYSFDTYKGKGNISHFFGALDPAIFGDKTQIASHIAELITKLKDSPKATGCDRIYIHGEKEYEKRKYSLENGIELDDVTCGMLKDISEKYNIPF